MRFVRKIVAFLVFLPAILIGGFAACAIAGAFVVLFAAIAGLDDLRTTAAAITGFCAVAVFAVLLSPFGEILEVVFGTADIFARSAQSPGQPGSPPHGGSQPAGSEDAA